MKRMIVFLLAAAMVLTLAACGAKEEKTQETEAAIEETVFAILEAKNCFYDAGYVELIAGAEESGAYTFKAEDSEAVEWRVYILDQAFDEGFRYIAQVAEPVLVGDGTVSVDVGKFVYVNCSANEFTTGVVDESAKLRITVK